MRHERGRQQGIYNDADKAGVYTFRIDGEAYHELERGAHYKLGVPDIKRQCVGENLYPGKNQPADKDSQRKYQYSPDIKPQKMKSSAQP